MMVVPSASLQGLHTYLAHSRRHGHYWLPCPHMGLPWNRPETGYEMHPISGVLLHVSAEVKEAFASADLITNGMSIPLLMLLTTQLWLGWSANLPHKVWRYPHSSTGIFWHYIFHLFLDRSDGLLASSSSVQTNLGWSIYDEASEPFTIFI